MDSKFKNSVWQQFGAAIDMLDNAIKACPEHLWTVALWDDPDDARYGQFWYVAYHTLSWMDLFLNGTREGFAPPEPFIRGALPDEPYSKPDIRGYVKHCRDKGKRIINGLTDETAYRICTFEWMEPTFVELQMYSMRHMQEHTGQLSLVLSQNGVEAPDWVPNADETEGLNQ